MSKVIIFEMIPKLFSYIHSFLVEFASERRSSLWGFIFVHFPTGNNLYFYIDA